MSVVVKHRDQTRNTLHEELHAFLEASRA